MNKILVTGAQGMLGCSLTPQLVNAGHDVICHSRSRGADMRGDLCDETWLSGALDRVAPGTVINLVGITDVDECERNPDAAYRGNVRTVENLVRWISMRSPRSRLIHISTDQVYDGPGPHAEDHVTLRNYYGFSKYAAELAALRVPSTILRTNFFGRSQCSGRTSLSDWIVGALRSRTPITVFDDVLFSPLTLSRLATLITTVVESPHFGVFNVGSKEGMSKADFAFALARVVGLETDNVTRGSSAGVKMAARRPTDMRLDSSRFEAWFGIELPTLLAEIESLGVFYANET